MFNALFKTIYPQTTQIIIDFPQQLILAYYFFKTKFPNAKILDFRNFDKCDFSRKELIKYDFILIIDSLTDEDIGGYDLTYGLKFF